MLGRMRVSGAGQGARVSRGSTGGGRTVAVVAAWGLLVTGVAGCNDASSSGGAAGAATSASSSTPTARIEVSVPDGMKGVGASSVVTVKAVGGELGAVSLASADGKRTVTGKVGSDKVWSSSGALLPGTTYKVTATARAEGGGQTTSTSSFTTVTPEKVIGYTVTPDGWTVGSGMPVQVNFDAPVRSAAAKAEIESRLSLTSTPAQPGAWGWTSDSTLMYRPQAYWAAGTSVVVKAPLAGLQVAPGAYLMEDNGATMTIGTQRVMRVDLAAHTMTLKENGALVRTFPISGGRPGERFETRGGTKLIQDKHAEIVMDSSTFGIDKADPEYYKTKVKWAMRITDSGEYLHSAPWSVPDQGRANVSHGCINMAPGDAEWLFNRVQYGDPVENVNSHIPLQPGESGIPVWLWSWPQWQAKSALAAKS